MDKNTAIWTTICLLVGVGVTMTGLVSVYLGYSCLVLAAILTLYQTNKWWMRLFARSSIKYQSTDTHKILLLQELYNELDRIGEGRTPNYQSIVISITELDQWHDKATRIISKLFGQDEAKKLIYNKDEYINPAVGAIKAFYNEKELYQKYLTALLDDVKRHPKLYDL